jgi:hypothetical protein
MSQREWLGAIVLGLLLSALLSIYFPAALAGSLAIGAFAAVRELRSLWPVVVGLVAGLAAVAYDLANDPDLVGFHLAATFTMCALAWSAWSIAGRLIRADHRG